MAPPRSALIVLALLRWYARVGRDLPWRRTRDPYRILVSEVMLQQTQVDRVRPKYEVFVRRWPTVRALARALRPSVIRAWSGLGLNRRAVNLHRAAQAIIREHGGRFPRDPAVLAKLPGIGPYTAHAVAVFAFRHPSAVIDTNVRRVLGRVLLGRTFPTLADDRRLRPFATHLVPLRAPDRWHHALMDLGALVCTPRPLCAICPVRTHCRAYPRVLTATRPGRSASERFEESDRYWRGRIVQLLVAQSAGRTLTLRSFHRHFALLPADRLRRLLASLVKEGLVERRASRQSFQLARTEYEKDPGTA